MQQAVARGGAGRNGLCSCGSGKKYKRCCLGGDARQGIRTAIQPETLATPALFQAALELHRQGHVQDAVALYRRMLAREPRNADVLHLLGVAAAQEYQYNLAVEYIARAIELKGTAPEYYQNLSTALRMMGDIPAAVGCLREAVRICRDNALLPELLGNLGEALMRLGSLAEAREAYEQALRLAPNSLGVRMQLANLQQKLCAWDGLEDRWAEVRAGVMNTHVGSVSPFFFLNVPSTAAEQLVCARTWAANHYAACEAEGRARLSMNKREPRKRLHIGYLSPDFNDGILAQLLPEMFERHDRLEFTISAYSTGPDDNSAIRGRIVQGVDRFVDLTGLPNAAAADRIHADGVDILLDLSGYLLKMRPEILALRPAPIQVNYLGYPGTLGASYMDYIIVDRFIVPSEHAIHFSERLAYLPDCYLPNDPLRPIASQAPTRAACGLPKEGFVFCAFNQSLKITPRLFAVWMRLLAATPGSVLWLPETNAWATANLREAAEQAGIDPRRLVFAPRLPLPEHFARHRLADLFLDTLPFNGHTTANDALWAGLPVLTCSGESFAARVAGSLLHAVGLPELVTASLPEYEALALALAHDPAQLAALRERLAVNRDTAPLFDCARYTRNLEALYRRMWEEYRHAPENRAEARTPLCADDPDIRLVKQAQ